MLLSCATNSGAARASLPNTWSLLAGFVRVCAAVLHQPGHLLPGQVQAGEEEDPPGVHDARLQGLLQTGTENSENSEFL